MPSEVKKTLSASRVTTVPFELFSDSQTCSEGAAVGQLLPASDTIWRPVHPKTAASVEPPQGAGRIPTDRGIRYSQGSPRPEIALPDPTPIPSDRPLAVFCDFDGTFSVQDVGSTLAQREMAAKRKRLWDRFEQGEFTPWTYAAALFDGFDFSEKKLDAFLETIDLDPGAEAMLAWCEAHAVPFKILSDGFDWNLDRLQAMNNVQFEYRANHLEFEGSLWRVASGGRNESCGCGTGSCKRTLIGEYRDANPDAFCVHIGNGRVSDLCGALAADLAFAKDTLAPALEEKNHPYRAFDTLHDVLAVLDAAGISNS